MATLRVDPDPGPVPRGAIVSVGTEVVGGDQVDSNAAWLARRLRASGVRPRLTLAVSDDLDELVDALELAIDRADVVVVGGGLGPTPDDRTRQAVAKVSGRPLVRRPELLEAIQERFASFARDMPASNASQADLPEGAVGMPPVGTAPGFSLTVDDVELHVLPGVPWELRTLFDRHVVAPVTELAGGRVEVARVVHVAGMGESDVAEALATLESDALADGVEVSYLAAQGSIRVGFTAAGSDPSDVEERVDAAVDGAVATLGSAVVGLDDDGLESAVAAMLEARELTMAVAESATGGLVLGRLTAVPGVSRVLRGGLVVYATDSKVGVAGIDPTLLEEHPPVSEPVTEALAVAVRDRFDADVGVATTGVAGPDRQDGVEVGTVVWAVADADGSQAWSRRFTGDRDTIRERLTTAAIDAVRRRLARP